MFKNIIIIFILFGVVISIALIGCNSKEVPKASNDQPTLISKGKDYLIGKDKLQGEGILEWQTKYSKEKGVFTKEFKGYTAVLIGLGEKPTGGISVEIKMVIKNEDKWIIKYIEGQPPKGSFVTQVITNVYQVVFIKDKVEDIEVIEIKNGQEIPQSITEIP